MRSRRNRSWGAVEPGHGRRSQSLNGVDHAGPDARRPEHEARRGRRRKPLRPRAVADHVNELTAQLASARAAEQQVREKLGSRVDGDLASVAQVRAQIATAEAQVKVSQAQVETTRAELETAKFEPRADHGVCAWRRHHGERDAPPRLLRRGHAVQRGDDVRRQRVPDLRAVQPERAAPGRRRQRSGDYARHLSGPRHQGARRLDHLGAGPGANGCERQSAANDRRRARPGDSR